MTSRIAKTLAAALLLGLSGAAMATTAVDIFGTPGIAGTGGSATVSGPCYCEVSALYSPVLLLGPGTYDLGQVRDWWVESGATPDAGPDQPNLWILFGPVSVAGTYPWDFTAPPLAFPTTTALCDQADTACNASHDGAFVDTTILLTVGPDQDAVQVSIFGPFVYTPPVPEPSVASLLALGLTWLAAMRRRRAPVG
ncbi:PEP-CTERM sorting domain-containing protein [Scleromatobacter humisilvae]|uniref:PEP-CTERM sorting domain-containing protein n=1 Tax=Scleromatobacter humisilvae TaxID=2897159 RepID=A0A9X1YH74_9BURK|nr:PEP-CTERM sorting domain-containing protein [Scleromatobacter humisilvae]MCK9686033.1 PEP-CTERM sorting domain-containing protein [Scleromatobacter humisilvae]